MPYSTLWKLARMSVGAAVALAGVNVMADASPATPGSPVRQVVADMNGTALNRDAAGSDAAQSHNAARSRMRECGHQWSALKKSGAAGGMTWKDFSQGCLAKQ